MDSVYGVDMELKIKLVIDNDADGTCDHFIVYKRLYGDHHVEYVGIECVECHSIWMVTT